MFNLRFPNGRLLAKGFALFSIALLSISTIASGYEVIICSRTDTGGVTACPYYCEGAGTWRNSGGGVTTNGSRFSTTPGASFSVTPTLTPGTSYEVSLAHTTIACSSNIIVAISTTGGNGLPDSTTSFQSGTGANWTYVGAFTVNSNTSTPTVTFTQSDGSLVGLNRFYADSVRFDAFPCGCGSTTPGPLSETHTSSDITLDWSGFFVLQCSTNLTTGFFDVSGLVVYGPYTDPITNAGPRFYRIRN